MRRGSWGPRLAAISVLSGVTLAALAPAAPAAAAEGPVAVLVVEGRGFGHGVGMAQEGALTMGRSGASTADILGHFYPGTALGRGSGQVRVVVANEADGDATLSFPNGGEVRSPLSGAQAPGFPVVVVPGGSVRLRSGGDGYTAEPLAGARVSSRAAGMDAAVPVVLPGAGRQVPPLPPPTAPPGSSPGPSPGPAPSPPPGPSSTTTLPPVTAPQRPPTPSSTTTSTAPTATTTPPTTPAPRPGATTSTTAGTAGTTTTTAATVLPPAGAPGATSTTATTAAAQAPAPAPAATAPLLPPTGDTATSRSPLFAVPVAGGMIGLAERSARYRGVLEAGGDGPLRLVNAVNVEDYLRGMGEVLDPRWPVAALGAQAVAARTYALRAMGVAGEICDSQRCQVYLGAQAEYPAMDAAVAATRGQVLFFGGGLASAVYSANGGGVTATTAEGFGTPDGAYPYLRAVPFETGDLDDWTVTVALSDLAPRVGYAGTLEGVVVATTGPSGRPVTIELQGSAGSQTVDALEVKRALGLRSTQWKVRADTAATAPPPPPPAEEADAEADVQALPEQVAQVLVEEQAEAVEAQEALVAAVAATGPRTRRPSDAIRSVGTVARAPEWLTVLLVTGLLLAGAAGALTLWTEQRRTLVDTGG